VRSPSPSPSPSASASDPRIDASQVEVRSIRTYGEFEACVALQDHTWGEHFGERVPAAILKVSQRIGGVTAGAFAPDGALLGFVFGMTGVERGRLIHWSDMLAVREDVRDLGIGRRLKAFQRDVVAALGVRVIYWTFDPLVARNAHLNFNRLGVRVVEYARDMYGTNPDSPLQRGLGTDRFIVAWPVSSVGAAPASPEAIARDAPILNGAAEQVWHGTARYVRVEIPPDIRQIQAAGIEGAAAWREVTRRAFLDGFARGYVVTGFYRDPGSKRCFYVLERSDDVVVET